MRALVIAASLLMALVVGHAPGAAPPAPNTPIEHLVVIFDENVSFDHYFGTYPNAANPPDQPYFAPLAGTPAVNGLNDTLLHDNPNLENPRRLDRSQAVTCDQDHAYTNEQRAFDGGLMDKFSEFTNGPGCPDRGFVMGYYDGNPVTALWNLAQHFPLSANHSGTPFGPSTPGAINLISGNTHGAGPAPNPGDVENGTMIGDPDSM